MQKYRPTLGVTLLLALSAAASAQVSLGYGSDSPLTGLAPGQLVTLFAEPNGVSLEQPLRAESFPLPTRLAGFGAFANFLDFGDPLSVFSVRRTDHGKIAVTFQMPFYDETFFPYSIGMLHPGGSYCGHLGTCEYPQEIARVRSAIHVLRTCDSVFLEPTRACEPLVTHANGALVSEQNRPRPGEILTTYAVGLGRPPELDESKPFNEFDDVVVSQQDCFTVFRDPPSPTAPRAEFAALLQPSVGIYQINFRVHEATAGSSCKWPPFGPQFTVGRIIDGVPNSWDSFQLARLAAPL